MSNFIYYKKVYYIKIFKINLLLKYAIPKYIKYIKRNFVVILFLAYLKNTLIYQKFFSKFFF